MDKIKAHALQVKSMEPILPTFRIHAITTDATLTERVRQTQQLCLAMAKALTLLRNDKHDEAMEALKEAADEERVFYRIPKPGTLVIEDGDAFE